MGNAVSHPLIEREGIKQDHSLRTRRLCLTLPEAICEAASRPSMCFISPIDIEQQDIQSTHRIRSRLVQERTALVNQIRGLLAEYGIIVPQTVYKIIKIAGNIRRCRK